MDQIVNEVSRQNCASIITECSQSTRKPSIMSTTANKKARITAGERLNTFRPLT